MNYSHKYAGLPGTPDLPCNKRHEWLIGCGPISMAAGWITPKEYECDLFVWHWRRWAFTIWIYRFGFGMKFNAATQKPE